MLQSDRCNTLVDDEILLFGICYIDLEAQLSKNITSIWEALHCDPDWWIVVLNHVQFLNVGDAYSLKLVLCPDSGSTIPAAYLAVSPYRTGSLCQLHHSLEQLALHSIMFTSLTRYKVCRFSTDIKLPTADSPDPSFKVVEFSI